MGCFWGALVRVCRVLAHWLVCSGLGVVVEILCGRAGGEFGGVAGSFPGQAVVVDEPAGQAQVGVWAAATSQVQRSAWSGVCSAGVVQPRVLLTNRGVCSMSKRRR